jgi:hypothetical protein
MQLLTNITTGVLVKLDSADPEILSAITMAFFTVKTKRDDEILAWSVDGAC